MRKIITAVVAASVLAVQVTSVSADPTRMAQATGGAGEKSSASAEKMPGRGVAQAVTVRGTISAIDKDKGTVTLKGPKGREVTLDVQDKSKFDVIKVGDPVVATYAEAIAIQVKKAGAGAPGTSVQETRGTAKPGETAGGAVGREITVTGTITKIDKKAGTVTIKGPEGKSETIKAKEPKNLDLVKAGDLVDITYTQALAISLDKPSDMPAKK